MSENGYMIWFIATAAMVVTVLTVGTLAAAGLLGRAKASAPRTTEEHDSPASGTGRERTADTNAAAAVTDDERRLMTDPEHAGRQ